jgi:isochorismate synthase
VVSRKETIDLVNFDLVSVFEKLIQSYPNAFVIVGFTQK